MTAGVAQKARFPQHTLYKNQTNYLRLMIHTLKPALVSRGQTAFFRFLFPCFRHHKEKRKKAVWPRETKLA